MKLWVAEAEAKRPSLPVSQLGPGQRTSMLHAHAKPGSRGAAVASLLAALALAGCTSLVSDPPVMASVQPLPEQWALARPGETQVPLDRYWTMLDDPLVEEFVARAQAENLDIVQATTRLMVARAGLRQAVAGFLPTISASIGAQRDVGNLRREGVQLSLGADIQWEADLFGRIDASRDASRADLQAVGYSLGDLQRVIVAQVATQVVAARSLAAQLAIARDTLANQDDNLQIARWRNQAGLVASLDVEQARTQRAQTAASIPELESDLVAVANAISTLIGEPPGRVYRALTQAPRAVPVPPSRIALAEPADLLRRRPDVSAAEARLTADLNRVGVARAQLYPLVRLTGSLNTGATAVDDLFSRVTGSVFAGISQLIFDGGRVRGQIDAARATADGSLAAWRQTILSALEEVESAAVGLDTGDARVAALTEGSEGAQNAAILARSQYQAGLIDFQTLLVSESQLLNTRTALVGAQGARARAFITLARAMGGGWSVPAGAAIDPTAGDLGS